METLGHYSIVEKLGEGGMGAVFKARDTRLDRFVALKILREKIISDERVRIRFAQEARAASALNHPNIIHIYDIGNDGGVDYIAMEYVAGRTLEQVIGGKPVPIDELVNYAIQIADALDVAHRRGIIHRDLKPGNVIVNDRGLVKVLDFGLAKLIEQPTASEGSETVSMVITPQTAAGVAVGTPAYMSPEQAEGRHVDARADIFSLGVMLYQMLTGVRPFTGKSSLSVLASVLRDHPAPLSSLVADVPPELESAVARCLQKDPDLRFAAVEDLKRELEELRDHRRSGRVSQIQSAIPVLPRQPPPSSEEVRQSRPWLWPVLAAVLATTVIGAGLWIFAGRPKTAPRENILTRLTSEDGLDTTPAISPDGKLLVYASDRAGEGSLDLWLRQIGGTGEPIRLTKDPADDYEPSFSADGTQIAFRSDRKGGGIYVMPALGGPEQLVVAQGRRPRFSPDGTKIAYWTGRTVGASPTRPGWGKAFVVDISRGSPVELQPDFAAVIHPIWTPDGKHVLFAGSKTTQADESASWWVTPLDGGPAVDTGFAASLPGGRVQLLLRSPVAWYKNRIIYYQSVDETTDVREVTITPGSWKVTGEPRKLTFGTTRDDFPSVSADGRLVFCSLSSNLDVFTLPLNANAASIGGDMRRVTNNKAYDSVRDISRDGTRLVFLSRRTGRLEVFGKDLTTGAERQLTNNNVDKRQPVISPDGETVAYAEDGTGANSIFLVPFAGGPQKPVCNKCGTQSGWAPDGKHLLITNYATLRIPISVLDVESGQTQPALTHAQYSLFPRSVSPDGKWISFGVDRGKRGVVLALAPFRPGNPPPESEWVYLTDGSSTDAYPRWSPDGNTIYYSSDRNGLIALFAQRLTPETKRPAGPPTAAYGFGKPSLRMSPVAMWISVAADRIAFSLEELKGNIWMLQLQN